MYQIKKRTIDRDSINFIFPAILTTGISHVLHLFADCAGNLQLSLLNRITIINTPRDRIDIKS